jgi:hypothetical protein
MIDGHIRNVINDIIERERDRVTVDWNSIEAQASAAISYINENDIEIDNLIYHFLEDADARRKSETYALHQTADVLRMLEEA